MKFKYTNQQIEEVVNWTLPGLTMYYRDSGLKSDEIDKFQVGQIFRSQAFVDVSSFAGKLTKNCRFIVASNKATPLYKMIPCTEKWKLHTINANSYFKVLDVYKKENKTQIFILHIPANGLDFFKNTILNTEGNNIEEQLIGKARESFDQKMLMQIVPGFEEKEWIERTNFPLGLDNNNNFFSIYPTVELFAQAIPLSNAIRKMTNDTELNIPIIKKRAKTKKIQSIKKNYLDKKTEV